ncbi:MAG: anti-sigma regulatory factor [Proteobacteria bacterium]|nr:anti-sigma regulatory factor [Pseudomonadota bacterium]
MIVTGNEKIELAASEDIVRARLAVRKKLVDLKFSLIDQTKMVTAASEIARNAIDYGGGGTLTLEELADGGKAGLRLIFEDHGPGIADIDLAMKDGYTSACGLGLGLSGSKRLVNEFSIDSVPGRGTIIILVRWKI